MTQYMQEAGAMKQLTDEEIMSVVDYWLVTGENQHKSDGYYYRSLGTPTNVRGSDLIEFARAIIAAVLPPTAGWKLVPMEPTEAMQMAGAMAVRMDTTALNRIWTGNAVWRAMLAAVDEGTLTAGKQGGDGVPASGGGQP